MISTSYLAPCAVLASVSLGACTSEGSLVELGVYNRDAQVEEASAQAQAPAVPYEAGAIDATTADAGPSQVEPPKAEASDGAPPDATSTITPDASDAGVAKDASTEAPVPPDPEDGPPCLVSGCFNTGLLEYDQTGLHCQRVTAHAAGSSQPYPVPTTPDAYVRFTFKMQNKDTEYVRWLRPMIDAVVALHHMKLYESHGEIPEGIATGNVTPAALRLVFSWAPNSRGLELHPSVGIRVEPNTYYTVESHFNLIDMRTITDASGFEVCSTPTKPPYEVSISRLGRDPVLATSSSATCTPAHSTTIQLLAMQAQMNTHGTRATLAINRVGASAPESVYDAAFVFGEGLMVPVGPRKVSPGDTLTATCYYNQLSLAGPGVADEVCNLHILHWPAHALVSANVTAGTTERCTQ